MRFDIISAVITALIILSMVTAAAALVLFPMWAMGVVLAGVCLAIVAFIYLSVEIFRDGL